LTFYYILCFFSLHNVRPLLEYNTVVWSPYIKQDIERLENVQRRFTKRLVGLKHVEYSERLQQLHLHSLELRILRTDLIWCYKIVFGLVRLNFGDFLKYLPLEATHVNYIRHTVLVSAVDFLPIA